MSTSPEEECDALTAVTRESLNLTSGLVPFLVFISLPSIVIAVAVFRAGLRLPGDRVLSKTFLFLAVVVNVGWTIGLVAASPSLVDYIVYALTFISLGLLAWLIIRERALRSPG